VRCSCGDAELATARKVMPRVCRDYDPSPGGPDSAGYQCFVEELAYRWAVTCQPCASDLDKYFDATNIYLYHQINK
jgi:hypothetical protein